MSALPGGWAEARLPDMIASAGVFTDGDWVESKDQDPNGDVRLIQLADVGDGKYRDRSVRFLTHQKAQELGCTYLTPGDALIARMPDPLGRACVFPGDSRASVTVVDVCIVRPGEGGVNPRWLVHAINAPQTRRAIASYQKGTTRKRVSRGNLALVPFPVPPLAEQERIAAAVEEKFSRLDAGLAAVERIRRNLRRIRSAVLMRAFSPLRVDPATLGADLFSFVTSGSRGWAKYYSRNGATFIRIGNVPRDGVDLDLTDIQHVTPPPGAEGRRTEVQDGDIVVSITADLGRVAVIPPSVGEAYINQHLALARPTDGALPRFLVSRQPAWPTTMGCTPARRDEDRART
jgi:type I restriction enzyme S subunit